MRNESESDPSKIVHSVLSDVISVPVDKAEYARLDQWHYVSDDDKMREK